MRGRTAAIDAVLELFGEGELRPATDVVIARAGVSSASLFRYFGSLDGLYRAAFEEQIARAEAIARVDAVQDRSTQERIAAFVAGRIAVYRSVAGVGRMARARAIDDPGIARGLERARSRWLAQVRAVFRQELDAHTRPMACGVASAIDAVASFETWDLLANERKMTDSAIETHWSTSIRALLS